MCSLSAVDSVFGGGFSETTMRSEKKSYEKAVGDSVGLRYE